jgi:hypothetical protein
MNLYLVNDTSASNHAGCRAVMRSLRACISEMQGVSLSGTVPHNDLKINEEVYSSADIIVINGEGTIHHSNPRALDLLRLIVRAKRDKKRVVLVNALFQQYEFEDGDVLGGLSLLTVREPRSAAFARRFGGDPSVLVDSAADARFLNHGRPIPGKSGVLVGGFHQKGLLYDPFAEIRGVPLTMRSGSFEDIVATLRGADVYLTAQHHGVYAAALASCPFVATPSNSHKIEAFIEWFGFPIPICMKLTEIESAMEFAMRNRSMYIELSECLRQAPILTSEVLGTAIGSSVQGKETLHFQSGTDYA